jgi:hypothetical protein
MVSILSDFPIPEDAMEAPEAFFEKHPKKFLRPPNNA